MNPDDLPEIIERHVPADAKESRDRDFILDFIRGGGPLFDRSRFDPGHLTGSAFIEDAPFERILLVHHAKLDRWLQPGGHGESEETDPFDVALREAHEETGLESLFFDSRIPFDLDVHEIPARKDEPAHLHLDVRYLFAASENAAPVASAESREIRWFPLDPENPAFDPSLRRAVRKIVALAP